MPQRYLAGLNEGRSGAAKKKKKKNLCLIKIKPKEMQGMVVVQIYILAFPIDKKKKKFHTTVILLSGIYRGFL